MAEYNMQSTKQSFKFDVNLIESQQNQSQEMASGDEIIKDEFSMKQGGTTLRQESF